MTISLQTGAEDVCSYTQEELKALFTNIVTSDETFGCFIEENHPSYKIKEIENNEVFCFKGEKTTRLVLDIDRDKAKKLRGKYDKNHFADLKNGFAKVIDIDTREVDVLVQFGFNAPDKNYKKVIDVRKAR